MIDELLAGVRAQLDRVTPAEAATLVAGGGLLVDIRPVGLRVRDGEIPGALVIDRNVLEWRLDPASAHRVEEIDDATYERAIILFCDEGYASSLAAASLQQLGLRRATDLEGGFQRWAAEARPVVADRDQGSDPAPG